MSASILPTQPGPLGVTRPTALTAATASPDQRLPPTLAIGARLEVQLTRSLSASHIEVRLRAPGQNIPWSAATRLQLSSPLPDSLARQLTAGTDARAASGHPVRMQADVIAVSPLLTLRILPQSGQPSGSATTPPAAGTREWMDTQLRQHLPQSRPLASTLESWVKTLSSADGLDTLSANQSPLTADTAQRMIATILSRLATTAELTDPERLPVALRQSGLWLESLMAQAAANPAQKIDLSLDLKGQLLRLAQQLRAANQAPPTPPTTPGTPSPVGPQPEPGAPKPGGHPAPSTDGRAPPTLPTAPGTPSPVRPPPEPGAPKPGDHPAPSTDGRAPPTPPTAPGTPSPVRPQMEPGAPKPNGHPAPSPDGRTPPTPPPAPDTPSPVGLQPEPGASKPDSTPVQPPAGRTPAAPSTEPVTPSPVRPQPEPGAPNPTEPVRPPNPAPSTDPAPQPQTRTPGTETPQPGNLAREVDGMIKQVVTQQLQTLEAGTDPPRWMLELPFKTPNGLLTLDADIQRETRADQSGEDGWNMRIRLNLPRLGPLSINLNLRADRLHAALQAEQQAAVDMLRQHLAELRQQLEDRQIEIASLHASQRPRHESPPSRRPPLVSAQA